MVDPPQYSVIVPAYEEADRIGGCVEALVAQSTARSAYEIIVVDDGSTDRTADIAASAGADLVHRIPHAGTAAARNAGLAQARGEIVLFTDADCEPGPAWVARMVAPFSGSGERVGHDVVGAKGTYRTRQTALIARLVQLEFEYRYERMADRDSIDFVDTYAAAYRKTILEAEGGFDTEYPVPSAEDVDLSFRLAQKGYRLVFVPDAWVWHTHPASPWPYLRRKMRFGYWRALLYLRFPGKILGDAHTDPWLKPQFGLLAAITVLSMVALITPVVWPGVVTGLAAFTLTTVPFVRWVWPRDRMVGVVWPAVALLRVFLQGLALGAGLVVHRLGVDRWKARQA